MPATAVFESLPCPWCDALLPAKDRRETWNLACPACGGIVSVPARKAPQRRRELPLVPDYKRDPRQNQLPLGEATISGLVPDET